MGVYMIPLKTPLVTYDRGGLKITRLYECDAKGRLEHELLSQRVYDFFKLKNGRTYVSIGASIGIWACDISSRVSDSTIYAIEPHPDTFQNLLFNTENNKHSNKIIPLMMAMSETDGEMAIQFGATQHNATFFAHAHNGMTRTVTWDSFIRENNIEDVYLIKIDTEGAEEGIFRGMSICLPECIVFAAYHVRNYKTAPASILCGILKGLGYYFPKEIGDVGFAIRNDKKVEDVVDGY